MQLFPALPEVVQGTFRPAPFGRLERRDGGPCERGIFIVDHTTNYQLSQWETTDRILMEDFNSDNAKIDAALAAHDAALASKADAADVTALTQTMAALTPKAGLQRIGGDLSVASASQYWTISLSAVNWAEWKAVYVYIDPYANSSGRYIITWGGNTSLSMGYQDVNTSLSGSGRRCPLVIFYPLFSGTQQAGGISIGTVNGGIFNLELDYGTNDSIVLVPNSSSSSYNFLPGSVCRIYGEK